METHCEVRIWVDEDPNFRIIEVGATNGIALLIGRSDRHSAVHFSAGDNVVKNLRALRDVIEAHLQKIDPQGEAASLIVDGAGQVFRTGHGGVEIGHVFNGEPPENVTFLRPKDD